MDQLHELYDHIAAANPTRPLLCPTPIDLGDGLILRRGEPTDRDELTAFNGEMHFSAAGRETFDLFSQKDKARHPTLDHSCVTVIVDTAKSNKIVSSVYSVPQVWVYGNPGDGESARKTQVPLIVTRLEAVATDPELRGNELIKKQFDLHHAWADALGASITFVGGMPQYYARFGYDLSPPRDQAVGGNKWSIAAHLEARKSNLAKDESLPRLGFRRATPVDSEFLTRLLRKNQSRREGIWTDIPASVWKNVLESRQAGAYNGHDLFVLEATTGDVVQACGFVQVNSMHGCVQIFEVDAAVENVSWSDATVELFGWLQEYHVEHWIAKKAALSAPMVPEQDAKKDPKPPSVTVEVNEAHQSVTDVSHKPSVPAAAEPGQVSLTPTSATATLPENWSFTISLGASHPCCITPPTTNLSTASITFENHTTSVAVMFGPHSAAGAAILDIQRGKVVAVRECEKGMTRKELNEMGVKFVCCNGTSWIRMVLGHRTASEVQENGDLVGNQAVILLLDMLFPRMKNDAVVGLN
ncbi:hypothetical protein HDU98_007372 [Podochytrium sp. JEL0797]|nr:hypothetical protein HDU98_007372 [Podochytrium sp. JEL0797]